MSRASGAHGAGWAVSVSGEVGRLCRELSPGYLRDVRGEYGSPEGYMVADREPEAFERFDAAFPPREKLRLRVRCSESGAPGRAWPGVSSVICRPLRRQVDLTGHRQNCADGQWVRAQSKAERQWGWPHGWQSRGLAEPCRP